MIRVNGDPLDWREGLTVQGILEARNYRFPLVIVTVNGQIVAKPDYGTTPVPEGAEVQVLHLISGG